MFYYASIVAENLNIQIISTVFLNIQLIKLPGIEQFTNIFQCSNKFPLVIIFLISFLCRQMNSLRINLQSTRSI